MKKSNKPKSQVELKTASGLDSEPVYLPEKGGERPGEYPYTRGIYDTMYRGKLWTMRQYAGFGSAREANKRYRYLLDQGTTGLSIAFDLPTQMGRDSDHPLARGEVGKVGVAICSIDDMEQLFEEIPLDQVSVSMTINATASILLAFYLVLAERKGVPWDKLQGTIQNDVLKEYIARGTYIFPPAPALRIISDIFGFCKDKVPSWNTISISGYHIREAGSTAVEELGLTLANGIAYVEKALEVGLKVDEFAPRLAFFFNCHNDFLEEIAKFRAARRLWAKIMKERLGAKDPASMRLRFHTQTAGSSLTAQQPLNNVVRTTIQAMAAVLGGTQSLHTNSFDEALGLPTEQSAELALRTQQIIAHESGVAISADPFGGSYLIESWTDRLEKEASDLIDEIDRMGGMVAAIEKGYPQKRIEHSAYRFQQELESTNRTVVGVNAFTTQREHPSEVFQPDVATEKEQVGRLTEFKAKRDKESARKSLEALKDGADSGINLMPLIIECVRKSATLGEISDALRAKFGEYRAGGIESR